MKPKIFLETDRLIFSGLLGSSEDESNLMELHSDVEVMQYLTNGRPDSIEDVKNFLSRNNELMETHHRRFGFWGAHLKSNNQFIGWFLFRPCKKDPENIEQIELGYRLRKEYWGLGLATEGSLQLLKRGFEDVALYSRPFIETIFATTLRRNIGSQKVMQKIGLKYEKSFIEEKFPGDDKEAVRYSLTRKQYFA